jgi:hypothetical protein
MRNPRLEEDKMESSKPQRSLRVTGKHQVIADPNVKVDESGGDVSIIVTQAFGPKGDNLVGISDVTFDGYKAVTLLVKANGREGLVHLSPIHGDARKVGFTDIPDGTRCELYCPVSKQPLDRVPDLPDDGARYFALYLTPKLDKGSLVAISDVWGHYHSRIVDNFELISSWMPS